MEFNATREELDFIRLICTRFEYMCSRVGAAIPRRATLVADLDACHSNGCPMDFEAMAGGPTRALMFDVVDIQRHIDRETGTLRGGFVPRYAKKGMS
jgi:hypothetical protein